ncbi:peptidylprolyl isomerase [Sphingosinicella rhizophila]|uniref:Peptidylprolyl isomerase n=1 Tax=Sphingosinicella rhizophila TaxID=3050082 RepID=A0ABU3Q7G7_9SPHN|nr:peptidylprolyl isomerase [Sphingosinicella sp. GR2756]MDT9599347.1 peptidylprolyl isomerase [Sphingosinicella sp. GR2756]
MRFTAAAALLLTSCAAGQGGSGLPEPSARHIFWRPAPVMGAPEPVRVVEAAPPAAWRAIAPEDLLIIDLKDGRRVAIELSREFAPIHVANVRAFARAGWWTGSAIYRMQDNYVAQWGIGEGKERALPGGVVRLPPPEYHRPLTGLAIRPLGFPDSYAPMVGHADSWPIGYDPEQGRAWLTHCYGAVGVSRDLAPDTGTGSELYAVIGHAPRHLDLNIALVGRVIDGMDALSARPRGTEALGLYKEESQYVPIVHARLAADMPAAERPAYEVLRSDSPSFSHYVTGRANRGGEFFGRPAGGVDICNVNVPVRRRVQH